MASQDGAQEVVVLFDATGSKVDLEMRYAQFNALLGQKATLSSHAASTVKAAYAQVGTGLSVRAVVFFLFKVNEQGYVDPAFNLPLDYMAQHAGEGPDLGSGPISMACRSQCPVPWHGINMWEPAEGRAHPAMLVQKLVWRNRLGLKVAPPAAAADTREAREARPAARPLDVTARLEAVVNGSGGNEADAEPVRAQLKSMDNKLTAAFGEAGRVSVTQYTRQHREQLGQVAHRFRSEMARQQQGYLDQIRACREEIQQLKAALRHEKERNRRLQQLLRGDV